MFGRFGPEDLPRGNMAFAAGGPGAHGWRFADDEQGWGRWGYGPRFGRRFGHGFCPGPMAGPLVWHMMRHFGRHFARDFARDFGPGFGPSFGPGFGPGFGHGPRMFGRGDLKYALLELLLERPKHGYEMIKDLENRAGGFYTPSAGAVYPTLQLLEDRGWVKAETQEGKKVYTITDTGRQELAEHQARRQERAERHGHGAGGWGGWGGWGEHGHRHGHVGPSPEARREIRGLAHEGREVARLMRAAVVASAGNPERLAQLRGIVERVRADLLTFLGTPGSQQRPGAGQHGQQQDSGTTGPVEQV